MFHARFSFRSSEPYMQFIEKSIDISLRYCLTILRKHLPPATLYAFPEKACRYNTQPTTFPFEVLFHVYMKYFDYHDTFPGY